MSKQTTKQAATTDAQRSTGYLVLGFLLSWLPLPISGLAALPLLASLFYGVRYQRFMRAHKAPAATQRMGWVSVGLTVLLIAMVVAPLARYQDSLEYQRCLWGANTNQARESCRAQFNEHPGQVTQFFLGE